MTLIIESCLLALCAGVAAVGYGSGLARFLLIHPNLGDRGILGLLVCGFLGCLLHFFVALSTPVQSVILACGVISAVVWRREIRNDASLGLATTVGLCIFALLRPQALINFDDGLYYLQSFKWNHEFPVIAGLGNLHGRLAYNSILFLIAPLMDRIEIGWVTNLLAVTFVMLSLWARLCQTEFSDRRGSMQYWFVMLAITIFVLRPGWLSWFGILTADSIAGVLIVYWVALALGLSFSKDRRTVFALLMLSAVLASMIKISAAPLGVLTLVLSWFHRKEEILRAPRIWALAATIMAGWMLHGVFLSGCAVYPVRQTCFLSLPWAVSLQQVNDEMMAIQSWARRPWELDFARVLQDWSWFPLWFGQIRQNRLMQLLAVGSVLAATAVSFAAVKGRKPSLDLTLISIGLAACLGFWFWSAPDPRFGAGFILAAALFGLSLAGATWLHQPRFYSYTPQLLILFMALTGLRHLWHLRTETFSSVPPTATVYQLRMVEGRRLWVPRTGAQCWAHELPCTPYVNLAALGRVRWPAPWPYRYDALLEPPPGWTPVSGVNPKSP